VNSSNFNPHIAVVITMYISDVHLGYLVGFRLESPWIRFNWIGVCGHLQTN